MNIKAKEYFDSLKGKKVAFVGMGVANVPCAEFCAKYGIEVYACDKRDKEYIGKDICDNLEKLGVHFSLGENYLDILPKMDLIFRSHGILPFQNSWNVLKEGRKSQQKWKCFLNSVHLKL
jgi:UDP-N-acetylmuramoylalanine--D-glutamate ligase